MWSTVYSRCAAALLGCWLAVGGTALAGNSGVKDGSHLFGDTARRDADREIADLQRRTHKDLLIETLPEISEEEIKQYQQLARRDRFQFWRDLAQERAGQAEINGIYVLLCARPAGHMVVCWPPENEPLFSSRDQRTIDRLLGKITQARHNQDQVLQEVIAEVDKTLSANISEREGLPIQEGFHWSWVLWGVAGLVGLWGVTGLARRRLMTRQGEWQPACTLISNMFGMTAGLWLFQRFFHEAVPSCPSVPTEQPPPAEETPPDHPGEESPPVGDPSAGEEKGPPPGPNLEGHDVNLTDPDNKNPTNPHESF